MPTWRSTAHVRCVQRREQLNVGSHSRSGSTVGVRCLPQQRPTCLLHGPVALVMVRIVFPLAYHLLYQINGPASCNAPCRPDAQLSRRRDRPPPTRQRTHARTGGGDLAAWPAPGGRCRSPARAGGGAFLRADGVLSEEVISGSRCGLTALGPGLGVPGSIKQRRGGHGSGGRAGGGPGGLIA